MGKNRDLPENSGPTQRELPEEMHDNTEIRIENEPVYPPPAMFLRGNVGEQTVCVPLWSYTVAMAAIDMYVKAGRKTKERVELFLWNTGGSWLPSDWTLLSKTSHSKR